MKPKLYSCLAIVLFAAIFVISCKKGDTGPAGPAGPAGAAGATGAQGPKGDSTTANITYSAWLSATFAVDTLHDLPDPAAIDTIDWSTVITAPKLTTTILSQGLVKVYWNLGSAAAPQIVELPYTDFVFGLNITTQFIVGKIGIFANANLSTQTVSGTLVGQFRYVLVPGTTPASVNLKDYSAVKNYFKLPD